jgi:hypothetical protein
VPIDPTPLGFLKPSGRVPVRQMDDVQSTNAQLAEDLIQDLRRRVTDTERFTGPTPGDITDNTMAAVAADPDSEFSAQLELLISKNSFSNIDGGAP